MTIRELLDKFFGRVRVEILECREGGSKPAKSICEFKNTTYKYIRDEILDKEVSGWKLGYDDGCQYVYIYYDAERG